MLPGWVCTSPGGRGLGGRGPGVRCPGGRGPGGRGPSDCGPDGHSPEGLVGMIQMDIVPGGHGQGVCTVGHCSIVRGPGGRGPGGHSLSRFDPGTHGPGGHAQLLRRLRLRIISIRKLT